VIFVVGAILMVLCLGVQVGAIAWIVRYHAHAGRRPADRRPFIAIFRQLTFVMFVLLGAALLQMALWAALYLGFDEVGNILDFETAMYFSGVTFTSLGYGDITLPPRIRLLSTMEAADGLMMFGITSAIFVGAMQHALRRLREHLERAGGGAAE
jgi:fucose permease